VSSALKAGGSKHRSSETIDQPNRRPLFITEKTTIKPGAIHSMSIT
jgi:hypothetical protein